jgi:hypothetical protein
MVEQHHTVPDRLQKKAKRKRDALWAERDCRKRKHAADFEAVNLEAELYNGELSSQPLSDDTFGETPLFFVLFTSAFM